jgi:hypothetical protein
MCVHHLRKRNNMKKEKTIQFYLFALLILTIQPIVKAQQIQFTKIQLIDTQTITKEWALLDVKSKRVESYVGSYRGWEQRKNKNRISNYLPLYLGKLDTVISIDYKMPYTALRAHSIHISENLTYKYQGFQSKKPLKLAIYVDTARIIGNCDEKYSWDSICYHAYPVFIYNQSRHNYVVAGYDHIILLLEAKNEVGQWVQIEEPYMEECGTGMTFPFMKPKQLMLTSCVVPKGDFHTRLRLRFGENTYSNEFNGTILKKQLLMMD